MQRHSARPDRRLLQEIARGTYERTREGVAAVRASRSAAGAQGAGARRFLAAMRRPMPITSCSACFNGRASSRTRQVLEPDDAVGDWFERVLDLYDGVGRKELPRGVNACRRQRHEDRHHRRRPRRALLRASDEEALPRLRHRPSTSAIARDDTFGFGVVFSDETLDNLMDYDAESYHGDHARVLLLGRDRLPFPRRGRPLHRPRLLRHRAPHVADGAAGALPRARRQAEFLHARSPISTSSPTPT